MIFAQTKAGGCRCRTLMTCWKQAKTNETAGAANQLKKKAKSKTHQDQQGGKQSRELIAGSSTNGLAKRTGKHQEG